MPSGLFVAGRRAFGIGKEHFGGRLPGRGRARWSGRVFAAFERNPRRTLNGRIASLIDSGRIGVIENHASDLSIELRSYRCAARNSSRLDAKRVVHRFVVRLRTRGGAELPRRLRESLSRMVSALAVVGVTVIMTCELETANNDLRFSPYGTAFMTDLRPIRSSCSATSKSGAVYGA